MALKKIWIKPKASKHATGGHPWIFSGAIEREEGTITAADTVAVYVGERCVGSGLYSPESQIRVRMFSREAVEFNSTHLRATLTFARNRRRELIGRHSNCYRLLNSEGDFTPGLVVDVYGQVAVMQLTTASMDARRDMIVRELQALGFTTIVERSDASARKAEGLEGVTQLICGTLPDPLMVMENGIQYHVDPLQGQKTGFFLDQRDNRALVRSLAKGKEVLNCFSYTGGFTLNALAGEASLVKSVEISSPALHTLGENIRLNKFDGSHHVMVREDVFEFLRAEESAYDIVILDPPPFVKRADKVQQALAGYKEINLMGMKHVNRGGYLLTFSCSGHIDMAGFEEVIRWAAIDSGRQVRVLQRLGAGFDHPRNICHREGEYLKGFLLQIV